MEIPISAAEGQLGELVRRAEAGDDVILTRGGTPVARLTPLAEKPDMAMRREVLVKALQVAAANAHKAKPGPNAARSQDFLYGEDGLPD